ncbi:MAG: hypothetical protein AB8G86_28980 [Saprospiraceae bacterium]
MEIDKKILFDGFEKMSKKELIEFLEVVFINLEPKSQRDAFGDLHYELVKKEQTPDDLLDDIENFYEKSLAGYYYESFMINSKNFSDVPEETDEWFDELSHYLDFTSYLVEAKNYKIAVKCFKILFELIDKMEAGEEIVFAHELGNWMIHANSDYIENYVIALAQTLSVEEYVAILIPLIKSDSYFSFANKVYKKVKTHSSQAQLKVIKAEIKQQGIRTA